MESGVHRDKSDLEGRREESFIHRLCSPFLLCFFLFGFCVPLCLPLPPGPHGFQERLAASQEAMKNKNVVNLGAIRQGMKRFQFLLNCCEPGTIPDASILAAALDLVCHLCFVLGFFSPVSHQECQKVYRTSSTSDLFRAGSPCGGPGLPLPGMRSLRSPLQPRQLARMDEGPPCQHHQAGPLPGPLTHRGQ